MGNKNQFRTQLIILSMLGLVLMSLFQNCSSNTFKSGSFGLLTSFILRNPEVVFDTTSEVYNSSNVNISFVTRVPENDSIVSILCQLDTTTPQDCSTQSVNYTNLNDGDYSFSVAVSTQLGFRVDARRLFRKDSTPPVVSVSLTPPSITNSTSAQFVFSASDNLSGVARIECSLDNLAFSTCTSPLNLSALSVASHNFRIRAFDRANNVSSIYSYNWSINTSSPTVTLLTTPLAVTSGTTAVFTFTGSNVVTYECQIDTNAYAPCTSPATYNALASGSHVFRVRGTSSAAVVSSISSYSWIVDNQAPTLPVITSSVSTTTNLRSASFNFSSTDALSSVAVYQCSLDNVAFANCTSPNSASNLSDGSHSFRVRSIDAAGNISAIAGLSFNVDGTAPVINFSQTPASGTTTTSATFAFSVTETNLASIQCSLDNAVFSNCTSPVNLTNLSVMIHNFRIQARDLAGNSTLATYSWAVLGAPSPAPAPTPTPTPAPAPNPGGGLAIDLTYVNQSSAQYTRFKGMVDAALAGNPDYGFEPQHAAMMYRITNDVRYCDYAITFAENCAGSRYAEPNCGVQGAEASIAAGGRPFVSGDSYLEVGPIIGSLAITYDWCAARMTSAQRTRWENYANQAIYNVWNPDSASWGGRTFTWSGWSIDNPGNNYYYSFVEATMYWALASRNSTMLALTRQKLQALVDYYSRIPGGGSLEGTGYGAAHMRLFQIYQVWKDSTGEDLANRSSHLTDSIRFWTHATTPNRAYYAPVGDLARSSFPDLFDYHRRIILEARRLTNDVNAQDLASWWLNHISVNQMSRRIDGQWDLLPAGSNSNATPNEPLSFRATGVGRVFARTSWDTNALWMSFNAGAYVESHAHQDQGSFTLANNTFLAVTNNIYSASGIEQSSDYHNIVRFQQGTTIIPQREGTTSTMTVNQLDVNGNADITANLTPAYGGNAAVQNWSRNVRFTNRTLTVTDNFSVSSGTQGIFQIHVPVQPVVSGNLITAGTLRIRIVSPANATVNVVNMGRYRIDISGGATGYVVELTDQ